MRPYEFEHIRILLVGHYTGPCRQGIRQMNEAEIKAAVDDVIKTTEAAGLKDMGKVMAVLRERFAGQMDFGQASVIVKTILAAK